MYIVCYYNVNMELYALLIEIFFDNPLFLITYFVTFMDPDISLCYGGNIIN